MSYGHAERNLAAIQQIVRETAELLDELTELDRAQRHWLRDSARQVTSRGITRALSCAEYEGFRPMTGLSLGVAAEGLRCAELDQNLIWVGEVEYPAEVRRPDRGVRYAERCDLVFPAFEFHC